MKHSRDESWPGDLLVLLVFRRQRTGVAQGNSGTRRCGFYGAGGGSEQQARLAEMLGLTKPSLRDGALKMGFRRNFLRIVLESKTV